MPNKKLKLPALPEGQFWRVKKFEWEMSLPNSVGTQATHGIYIIRESDEAVLYSDEVFIVWDMGRIKYEVTPESIQMSAHRVLKKIEMSKRHEEERKARAIASEAAKALARSLEGDYR